MSRLDAINIPTAEEMATAHVRECYYRLVNLIAENIDYSALRGNTSVLESIPIDFLEAIVFKVIKMSLISNRTFSCSM